tara:strand:+ start:168 stop:290 length:123 start_codon:yes stop_codon:yes gene_type:complete
MTLGRKLLSNFMTDVQLVKPISPKEESKGSKDDLGKKLPE